MRWMISGLMVLAAAVGLAACAPASTNSTGMNPVATSPAAGLGIGLRLAAQSGAPVLMSMSMGGGWWAVGWGRRADGATGAGR